jgi:hypothetical protein
MATVICVLWLISLGISAYFGGHFSNFDFWKAVSPHRIWNYGLAFFKTVLSTLVPLILGYVGLIVTVYWNLDSQYGRKWQVIATKFYDIGGWKSERRRNLYFLNLWQDALDLKIWADPALNEMIFYFAKLALLYKHGETGKLDTPKTSVDLQAIERGEWTKRDIFDLLKIYQESLPLEDEPSKSWKDFFSIDQRSQDK